ncbi:UDP-glucuronate 4-epimerase 2 [Platanthera guangdongensis]|uniref:UDP-glucuronate 4-epimerase 2 n=1 Tax=Platanthera guangdongensis TaxID=2320717 RepID=A0ABR2LYL9_9ASPA
MGDRNLTSPLSHSSAVTAANGAAAAAIGSLTTASTTATHSLVIEQANNLRLFSVYDRISHILNSGARYETSEQIRNYFSLAKGPLKTDLSRSVLTLFWNRRSSCPLPSSSFPISAGDELLSLLLVGGASSSRVFCVPGHDTKKHRLRRNKARAAQLRVFNLDNTSPVPVVELVSIPERHLKVKARRKFGKVPRNGDVLFTGGKQKQPWIDDLKATEDNQLRTDYYGEPGWDDNGATFELVIYANNLHRDFQLANESANAFHSSSEP